MLAELSFPIPLRRTFYYLLPEALEQQAAPGLRALASLGRREAVGVILRVLAEKDADMTGIKELKPVIKLLEDSPLFPEDAPALAEWMSGRWGSSEGLCLGAFYAHAPRELPPPAAEEPAALPPPAAEIPELKGICAALCAPGGGTSLLRLGAGQRDSAYAGICRAVLAGTAQGLLLVPDLSFIPQLAAALEFVFPGRVGVWHARLTPKRRAEAWAGAQSGAFKVVIATRTGVFLPFRELRLALMDSEQEEVYKQEEAEPFYHAREVLLRRMKALGGRAVLAGDCPSIESWGRAASGEYSRFDIAPSGVLGGPDVRVLDMTQYPGDALARPLSDAIHAAVTAGRQALVIAARKGYASRLFCANCGWMPRCEGCGPGLTILKAPGAVPALLCRRCGKKSPFPVTCPKCGGRVFNDCGSGTQKVEAYLRALLPGAAVSRFDGDVLKGSLKTMKEALDSFTRGDCAVLVGTRIALRDVGAPRLGLVAFLDADADLSSPDFRAAEKAFQSFHTAWRMLRKDGALFVQTREPGHYVFSRLQDMDYPSFADGELAARKDFLYPPFSWLLKVRFASIDRNSMDAAAGDLKRCLSFVGKPGSEGEILGPVQPQGQEKRRFYSEYYLVKAASEELVTRCFARVSALRQRPHVKYFIEPDPYGFH